MAEAEKRGGKYVQITRLSNLPDEAKGRRVLAARSWNTQQAALAIVVAAAADDDSAEQLAEMGKAFGVAAERPGRRREGAVPKKAWPG